MSVKRNLFANYLGQGWAAIMSLAFIPLYIKYLGMEAFGLIGLFAVMQALLTLFDMGMTPTLNREMARYSAGAQSLQSIRDLLRTLETLCFSLAALVCVGVGFASSYLANDWLKVDKLPISVVSQSLTIMAFVVALRLVEGIYRGALLGLQRQVLLNRIIAIFATLRFGGVVAVLIWVSPTIQAFFLWQSLVSIICISVFAASVHRSLPKPAVPSRFSRDAIASVWKFARGMIGISFLTLLLTQLDKVILSRILPLESFGYYIFAATITSALYMILGPIGQAIYPRMVVLHASDDQASLISVYHLGAQMVTTLTAPAAALLYLFAPGVAFMWSGDAILAAKAAPILSILALGTFLYGLRWIPHDCQLAHGWTSLPIKTSVVAVVVIIPALFWFVPIYGALGAAWIWVVLNTGHTLLTIHFMHKRIIPYEKWRWYFADVLLPLAGTMGVMLLAQRYQPHSYQNRWYWFMFLLITGSMALMVSAALGNRIRPLLWSQFSLLKISIRSRIAMPQTKPNKNG